MGMSRCYSLMKCLLIIFNIVFLVVGCGVASFAAWAVYDGAAGGSAAGRAGLGALGAWALVLACGAACGVWGAARHSPPALAASFALLALSLVAEGAAAWWGAAHLPALRAALADTLARSVAEDYGAVPARTHALDAIQRGLQCCGAHGPRDWQAAAWARAGAGAGADADEAGRPAAQARAALDLSVSAPPAYYWVPGSCCVSADEVECAVARRVAAAGAGAGAGVWGAGCAARALHALAAAARAPLLAAAALLATHAVALLLSLALTLRATPPAHKA